MKKSLKIFITVFILLFFGVVTKTYSQGLNPVWYQQNNIKYIALPTNEFNIIIKDIETCKQVKEENVILHSIILNNESIKINLNKKIEKMDTLLQIKEQEGNIKDAIISNKDKEIALLNDNIKVYKKKIVKKNITIVGVAVVSVLLLVIVR